MSYDPEKWYYDYEPGTTLETIIDRWQKQRPGKDSRGRPLLPQYLCRRALPHETVLSLKLTMNYYLRMPGVHQKLARPPVVSRPPAKEPGGFLGKAEAFPAARAGRLLRQRCGPD